MKAALSALLVLLACAVSRTAAASDKTLKPCTVVSPTTERFFDLNGLRRTLPKDGDKKKDVDEGSWHAKGYDYGANFTVNFCGPVVEEGVPVRESGRQIFEQLLRIASGERTKSEELGYGDHEFAPWQLATTL